MRTLAYSEDLDEMLDNAAYHQGLHCLLRRNPSSEKEIQFYLQNINCDPSIYTIDHPKFIVSTRGKKPLVHYGLMPL